MLVIRLLKDLVECFVISAKKTHLFLLGLAPARLSLYGSVTVLKYKGSMIPRSVTDVVNRVDVTLLTLRIHQARPINASN